MNSLATKKLYSHDQSGLTITGAIVGWDDEVGILHGLRRWGEMLDVGGNWFDVVLMGPLDELIVLVEDPVRGSASLDAVPQHWSRVGVVWR